MPTTGNHSKLWDILRLHRFFISAGSSFAASQLRKQARGQLAMNILLRRSLILPDLTHLQRIRQEMPATTSHVYLNTGTFGPLPACVISAMQERLDSEWRNGRLGAEAFESMGKIYSEARSRAAHLLNAREGEIALTDN